MPLTPKDIEQKTFSASFRGYAEDEVDVFLEEVIISISEYQQMVRERDALLAGSGTTPTTPTATPVEDPAGANAEANRILQAARRQAEQILADARAEGGLIAASAAPAAGILTPEQEAERQRLIAGYERLRDELSAVRARVQRALTASDEAFGIVETQVDGMLSDAAAASEPSPAPSPEEEELPPPRRPWEG